MDNKHNIFLIPNLVLGNAASVCILFPREYYVFTSKGNLYIIDLDIKCDNYILFNHLILVTNWIIKFYNSRIRDQQFKPFFRKDIEPRDINTNKYNV